MNDEPTSALRQQLFDLAGWLERWHFYGPGKADGLEGKVDETVKALHEARSAIARLGARRAEMERLAEELSDLRRDPFVSAAMRARLDMLHDHASRSSGVFEVAGLCFGYVFDVELGRSGDDDELTDEQMDALLVAYAADQREAQAHEVREVAMLCLAEVHTGTGAEASAIVDRVMAERYGNPQSAHVAQKERA